MPFLILVLLLVTIGLVMMFSASYPNAFYLHKGDSFFFIRNQAIFAVMGLALMLFVSKLNYQSLKILHLPILITSFVLLLLVLAMPPINGVRRWIQLGPIGFQPSEITKFAIILSFATLIDKNFEKMGTFRYGILPFLIIFLPSAALLAMEPHISCTVIVILLAAIMLFIGGIKLRWFAYVLAPMMGFLGYLVLFTNKLTYANSRIAGWLNPFDSASGVDTWQTRQGLYAIGSGGIFGLGLGNSRQKYLYIPEPQNDFIFAVVCEELGFIGAVIILILFATLIWRGIVISIRAKDRFGTLLGLGLTMQVGMQMILNIAVVTNTIPNTGISLPFFSYGGTSLLMLLVQMGIILSISRGSNIEKT
ncbi:MAG: cell division protein FtsW [Clostridia bacterium]|nr:cell division protein FtsW [Clostridia bacterium]